MSSSSPLNSPLQDAVPGHNAKSGVGALQHAAGVRHGEHAYIERGYVPVRQLTGKVVGVWGDAHIRLLNGDVVPLHVGDVVHKGEVVLTAQDGIIQIEASRTLLADGTAGDDVERIISQVNQGDADVVPAAGPNSGGAAGSLGEGLRVGRDAEAVTPASLDANPLATPTATPQPQAVSPLATAPVANPDTETTAANTPVAFDPRGNDTSSSGLTITQVAGQPIGPGTSVTLPNGVVSMNPDGTLTFTPNHDFNGSLTFTYTDVNGQGTSATSTVTVNVGNVNEHAPVAVGDTVSTHFNTPVTIPVLANDTDADGDPLTITQVAGQPITAGGPAVSIVVNGVTEGSVTLDNAGHLVFTPTSGYAGPATFSYTIDDGHGGTSTASVSVAVDHPPVAVDDTVSAPFNTPVTIPVLANDTDADGDTLSVTQVNGQDITAGGPAVTIVAGGVTEGSVALDNAGHLVFTPAPGYAGPATFTYTADDGHGGASTATVNVAVDHPPVATGDSVSAGFDTPVTIPVLANDTDPDGDPLTVTQVGGQPITAGGPAVAIVVGGVTEGSVTLGTDGQLTFTPAPGYSGPATFTYTADDGHGGTSTATVNVAVDHPPVATDDTVATNFGTPVTIPVLANDTDADGDPLTITQVGGQPITAGGPAVTLVVGGVTEGSVTLGTDGQLTFTPAPGYSGPATFTYTADDGHGGTATATVNVAVDHPPVAGADTVSAGFDTPVTIPVLANDTDADGDTLTVTQVNGQAITAGGAAVAIVVGGLTEGSVTLGTDGQLTFTPAPGYTGPATFPYTVSDGHGGTSTASVTVNVDHPPLAGADTVSAGFDTPVTIAVLANDTDADGDTLTVTQVNGQAITAGGPAVTVVVGGVTEGTVALGTDGRLTFTPAPGYAGPATFPYTVSDGHGGTSTASVTVNVDHPPVATGDTVSTNFNAPVTVAVLANDTDADGDTLTVTQVNGQAITAGGPAVTIVVGGVTEGSVTLGTDGQLTFTPAPGYSGAATSPYTVTDGHGGTSTASVTVNVDHPPVAHDDIAAANLNTPVTIEVLANDTDADGDALTITQVNGQAVTAGGPGIAVVVGGVTEGSVTLGADGKLTFTPAPGYSGPASFTYTISDGHGGSSTATASVSIDNAPVAADDTRFTDFNTPVTIAVLANDTDVDGDALTVTHVNGLAITAGGPAVTIVVGGVTEGSVTLDATGHLTFTPAPGYAGAATFPYTVDDGKGGTSTANVTVNVDHPPVAVGDTVAAGFNTPVTISVLANDTDADGDTLTVTQVNGQNITAGGAAVTVVVGGVTEGTVALGTDGKLTFTPAAGYTGPATFPYTISDGHGGTSTANVTVNVDHPPVAVADTVSAGFDTPVTISVLANDTDADGDTLTVTQVNGLAITAGGAPVTVVVGGVTEGTVALGTDGKLTFTPAAGYTGPATFPYTISDGHGGTSTANVTVNVDHPPVAVADTVSAGFNTPVTIAVLANDTDADSSDTLTVTQVNGQDITAGGAAITVVIGGVTEGTVALGTDGKLTFTPVAGYTGPATFPYTISDGHGGTSTANVTVNVDHPPVAVADTVSGGFNTPVTIAVLANDTDADGDTLTVTQVNGQNITAGGAPVTVVVSGVTEGTVAFGTDGKLTFTPATGYTGPATFPYTISDGHGGTSTANVTVNVDHPPVAVADTVSAGFNTPVTIAVLANDTDADSDTLKVTQVNGQAITAGGAPVTLVVGGVTEGTVALGTDGKLTFTPATGYTGPASFPYTISDGHGGTSTANVTVNVDHPPVATADTVSTNFNTAVAIPVLVNDTDADSDTLTVTQVNGQNITAGGAAITVVVGGVAEGTVALGTDGKLTFTPAAGYTGPAMFPYTISDGHGGTSTANVTVNVDHPPVAVADTVSAGFDTPVTIAVLANDTDADSDTLTVTQVNGQNITAGGAAITVVVGGVTEGTVALGTDGKLTFTPATGYTGPATFPYTISDGHGGTSTANVTVNVDHPPVAVADTVSTNFNTAVAIPVLANDTDADGDTLIVTQVNGQNITAGGAAITVVVGGITEGTVALGTDGKLTFTPVAGYTGPATFPYTISDGHGGTSTANVTVNVDHPPVAVADTVSAGFNTPVTIAVLANDTDAESDTLTVTQVNGQNITAGGAAITVVVGGITEGTVALGTDGKLTFTPAAGYTGPATFPYTISDGHGGTSTANVTVNVDHPPVATADTVSGGFNTPVTIAVLANDTDADGDTLTVTQVNGQNITAGGAPVTVVVGGVTEGTVALGTDGKLTFTPATGYTGPATFPYTISDGHGGTSTANVTVNVDHPPLAVADSVSTNFNTAVAIPVLANDTDADSDTLIVTQVNGENITAGGVAITVVVGGVTEGTVKLGTDGTLTFTPAAGYTGAATFPYTISDGHGGISTANVTVNVDHPPVATADTVSTNFNTAVAIPVLANDTDADKDTLTVTQVNGQNITAGGVAITVVVGGVTEGTVKLGTDGTLTFTPAAGYTGAATFPYTISDGHGGTATANVTVSVDHPPVATADTVSTNFNTAVAIPVLANDTDADGDMLTVTQVNGQNITAGGAAITVVVGGVTEGTVALGTDGKLTFTPVTGYTGAATFPYTISDGHGGTSTANVTVNVDHPPVAVADTVSANFNTPVTIAVLANDTDADSDALTVTQVNGQNITAGGAAITVVVGGVTEGTVALGTDGKLTFTPATGYTGAATFPYTISDGHGGTSTANVTVNVDHPPVAVADTVSTNFNTAVAIPVLANDTDADGDTLIVTQVNGQNITAGGAAITVVVGGITEGTVALGTDGKLTFTPATGYTGAASFPYTISDGHGGTSTANVTVNVDHPPVAVADTVSTNFNTAVAIPILANDTDADSDTLTVTQVNGQNITAGGAAITVVVGGVTEGTVALGTDGKLTFTPATGYTGAATFPYTISDGHGGISTANVTVNVDHPPVATADTVSTNFNTAVAIPVLANDTDADGDMPTVTQVNGQNITAGGAAITVVVGGVTEGTVALGTDGKLTFTPVTGYTGAATFPYTISDGHGGTSTANVTVNVDHPPVAVADTVSANFNTPVTIAVLANDTDADSDALTVTQVNGQNITAGGAAITVVVAGVTEGTVALGTDGKLTFTPAAGYTGAATFPYTISDSHGGTSTANVTVTVDTPPVAVADTYTDQRGVTLVLNGAAGSANHALTTNDTDVNGDTLTVTQINGTAIAAGGSVAVTNGTVSMDSSGILSFKPSTSTFTGTATFNYTISDGHGGTSTTTATVTVAAGNTAPVANADTYTTNEDTALVLSGAAGSATHAFTSNDTDANGDTLTVTQVNGAAFDATHPATILVGGVTAGTLSMNASGIVTFVPASNWSGNATFNYTVSDGNGATSTANVSVTVIPVADAPTLTATDKTYYAATNLEESGITGSYGNVSVTKLGTGSGTTTATHAGTWQTDNGGNTVEIGTGSTYGAKNADGTADTSHVIELEQNPNDASNLYTTMTTRAGEVYNLSFDYAARASNPTSSIIYVYWEGQLVDTLNTQSATLTHVNLQLVSTTGTGKLEFVAGDSNSFGGVLDNITLGLAANTGIQGYATNLPAIAAGLVDTDGSETLKVTIDTIPAGATLTDGTHTFTSTAGNTTADVTGWTLGSLSMTSPTAGDFTLGVHATSTETANGSTATSNTSVTVHVLDDSAGVYGTAGNDTMAWTDASTSVSTIHWGLDGNDSLTGSIGHDTLMGGSGNDTLRAGSGPTLLDGGTGNDSLVAGSGADTLSGGQGNDTMTAGTTTVTDVFKWHLGDAGSEGTTTGHAAVDTIINFDSGKASAGGDILDLRDLLVGENAGATTQASALTHFLDFDTTSTAGSTIIHISSHGDFANGYAANNEDQTIVLQGVDLRASMGLAANSTDAQVISELLNRGKLMTDGQ